MEKGPLNAAVTTLNKVSGAWKPRVPLHWQEFREINWLVGWVICLCVWGFCLWAPPGTADAHREGPSLNFQYMVFISQYPAPCTVCCPNHTAGVGSHTRARNLGILRWIAAKAATWKLQPQTSWETSGKIVIKDETDVIERTPSPNMHSKRDNYSKTQ